MLNEPVQEAGQGGSGGVAEAGGGHMNYIQVTPQEKEAIERVMLFNTFLMFCFSHEYQNGLKNINKRFLIE